ncbi:MAG TPA: hypothetical protein VNO84_07145 [Burkholderiaceae bacterium]|nr:hypothetical protein [Burkholderiaceae bacterium]
MRVLFSLAALIAVVALVGLLLKKQLGATPVPAVAPAEVPADAGQTQRQQIQGQLQQLQRDLNQAVQSSASRAEP